MKLVCEIFPDRWALGNALQLTAALAIAVAAVTILLS